LGEWINDPLTGLLSNVGWLDFWIVRNNGLNLGSVLSLGKCDRCLVNRHNGRNYLSGWFGTNVLVKGLLIEAIIEWIISIRGIMLTWNLKKKN
jgi:hypothetical protein